VSRTRHLIEDNIHQPNYKYYVDVSYTRHNENSKHVWYYLFCRQNNFFCLSKAQKKLAKQLNLYYYMQCYVN
jgi:hypothetical protein